MKLEKGTNVQTTTGDEISHNGAVIKPHDYFSVRPKVYLGTTQS